MPGRSSPSKIRLRTYDAMCSPLGVRTSFACRPVFERPFAAARAREGGDGIRISYADLGTERPISAFSWSPSRGHRRRGGMAQRSETADMIKYTICPDGTRGLRAHV